MLLRKRYIGICLFLMFLTTSLSASSETFSSGDFEYSVNADTPGLVKVTKYTGLPADGVVTIPATVSDGSGNEYTVSVIGSSLFEKNNKISEVVIPETVTKIESFAFSSSGVKILHLPSNLTSIEASAFATCVNLEEVVIPDKVTELPNALFCDSRSLKRVTVGSSVTQIGRNVFTVNTANYQMELEELVFRGETVPVAKDATNLFNDYIKRNTTVKVPIGSLESYKSSDLLQGFEHIEGVEFGTEGPNPETVFIQFRLPDSKAKLGLKLKYGESQTIYVGHEDGRTLESVVSEHGTVSDVISDSFTVTPLCDEIYTIVFRDDVMTVVGKTEPDRSVCLRVEGRNIVVDGTTTDVADINVYSITGELLYSQSACHLPMNIGELSSGVSIVKVTQGSKVFTYKIVSA